MIEVIYRSIPDKNWRQWKEEKQMPEKPQKPVKISGIEKKSKQYADSWRL